MGGRPGSALTAVLPGFRCPDERARPGAPPKKFGATTGRTLPRHRLKRPTSVGDQCGSEGAAPWRDRARVDVADDFADIALGCSGEAVFGEAFVVGEHDDPPHWASE